MAVIVMKPLGVRLRHVLLIRHGFPADARTLITQHGDGDVVKLSPQEGLSAAAEWTRESPMEESASSTKRTLLFQQQQGPTTPCLRGSLATVGRMPALLGVKFQNAYGTGARGEAPRGTGTAPAPSETDFIRRMEN
ncbi:hypothetical protein TcBrA4_0045910 [Trypanosoma cruzi]|nr:hypothetical protein TcBrA4_0045910 [Trypanosoma cruzi]